MHLEVLAVLVVVAAALAAHMPSIGEVTTLTTASGRNTGLINVLSFLGLVPTSSTPQLDVTFFKRQYQSLVDSSLYQNDPEVLALVIICIFLEVLLILITLWVVLYICILWRRKKQCLHRNAERQRAEDLLNSHPQPIDTELGVVHHSAPHCPEQQDTESSNARAGTATGPGAHNDGIHIRFSKAVIPEIHAIDQETMQESKGEIDNPESGIITLCTHVEGFYLQPLTYRPTSYHPESEAANNNTTEPSDIEVRFPPPTASK